MERTEVDIQIQYLEHMKNNDGNSAQEETTTTVATEPSSGSASSGTATVSTNSTNLITGTRFSCHICTKSFTRKNDVKRHIIKFHGEENVPKVNDGNSLCLSCGSSFVHISNLREHLHEKHKMVFLTEHKEFNSYKEFEDWKCSLEDQECCTYIKQGSQRIQKECKVQYWQCNRSGVYKPKLGKKRQSKKLGTCKIGKNCTCTLKVTTKSKKCVSVDACHTHYGHTRELQHTRITKNAREEIATKMRQGVAVGEIIDGIRNDGANSFKRTHIIKRKDITNIRRSYGINGTIQRNTEQEEDSLKGTTTEETDHTESLESDEASIEEEVAETISQIHSSTINNHPTWLEKSVSLLTESLENGEASIEQQVAETISQLHSSNTNNHSTLFEKSVSLLTGLLARVNGSNSLDINALENLNNQLLSATNTYDQMCKSNGGKNINSNLTIHLPEMKNLEKHNNFSLTKGKRKQKDNAYTLKSCEVGQGNTGDRISHKKRIKCES